MDDDITKTLKKMQAELKGKFPAGAISPDDEGALAMAITSNNGLVQVHFARTVRWFAIPPDLAEGMAQHLMKYAASAREELAQMAIAAQGQVRQ